MVKSSNAKIRWRNSYYELCGVPQGGVISPMLSNLFMAIMHLINGWKEMIQKLDGVDMR